MRLHYAETMNPRKTCALAKHLGLPIEYVFVDIGAGGLTTASYLAKNPNGLAPVLEDGERTIWESSAIMAYLSIKAESDLWPARDPMRQVEVLRWVAWDATRFAPSVGAFYFEHAVKRMFDLGPPDQQVLDAKRPVLHKAAKVLDAHLSDKKFLLGDALSMADFCTATTLPLAREIELPIDEYKNVLRWHERLMELPAWRDPWPAR